jgi:replicative DNA helicase
MEKKNGFFRSPLIDSPLPDNVEAERLTLGAILGDVDGQIFLQVAAVLEANDYSLEKHKILFLRMTDLAAHGSRIDRVTLANECIKHGQLEAVGGLSYITKLDDGLPPLHNLASYVAIVKEKALLRRIVWVAQASAERSVRGTDSSQEILDALEESVLKLNELQASPDTLQNPLQIVERFPGGINAYLDPSQRAPGRATGFVKFDEMTGGLREGELFILAARPAMGKTAFALNIAQHVAIHAKEPRPVAIFSLEMSKESLLTRLLCSFARVDQQRYRQGYLSAVERQALSNALHRHVEAPLYIDDTAGTHLLDIHSKLRRLTAERGKLGLVIIDYLQLMQGRGRFENRVQEISSLSRGFKLMSKELEVPFMVLSQLSRAPETRPGDHRPMLSDLRESGSIEQDADVVAFIFREEIYKPDKESLRGLAELILAKQRNGPTGRIKLAFLNRYTKFENLAGSGDDEEAPPLYREEAGDLSNLRDVRPHSGPLHWLDNLERSHEEREDEQ